MKLTGFALAASLIATPAAAQDMCDNIKFDYGWEFLNVAVEVNVPMNKVCIGMSSDDPAVKSITPPKDKPFCFDTGVEAMQVLTPKITLLDGTDVTLPPMGLEDARLTMKLAHKKCETMLGATL